MKELVFCGNSSVEEIKEAKSARKLKKPKEKAEIKALSIPK